MDGLWYAAVTVTTVGYGDKVAITGLGRMIASFWMIFGLICFGMFGGAVVAEIAEMQADQYIQDVSSLRGITVV
jgi:polar amino acid transport system substrate-binding protein